MTSAETTEAPLSLAKAVHRALEGIETGKLAAFNDELAANGRCQYIYPNNPGCHCVVGMGLSAAAKKQLVGDRFGRNYAYVAGLPDDWLKDIPRSEVAVLSRLQRRHDAVLEACGNVLFERADYHRSRLKRALEALAKIHPDPDLKAAV